MSILILNNLLSHSSLKYLLWGIKYLMFLFLNGINLIPIFLKF